MSEKKRSHAQFAQAQHESGDAQSFLSPSSLGRDFGARWDNGQKRWVFPDGSVGVFSRFETVSAETMVIDAQAYRLKLARWNEDQDAGIFSPKPQKAVKVVKTVPAFQAVEADTYVPASAQELLASAESEAVPSPSIRQATSAEIASQGQTEPQGLPDKPAPKPRGGRVARIDAGDDDPDYK